jgi:hypothetical protein
MAPKVPHQDEQPTNPPADIMTEEQYRELQKEHPDVLKEGLGSVVTGVESAEKEKKRLGEMREATGEKAKAATGVELSAEQAELLEKLEAQYPKMQATLERYEISTEGMPTWEQVKKGLTPEVLDKALKLAEPTLLLIPPTPRQSKVEAINKHPAKGQKYDTATYKLNDNDLWNGGKSKAENKWRVSIVDGIQDVQQDNEIYEGERTNYEMSKAWVKKYEEQGLDVMNDSDAYLTLMMKGLAEGKPIDPNTFSVLNGKNLTKTSRIAFGYWNVVQVRMAYVNSFVTSGNLRLRGSVDVDVQS